MCFKCKTSRAEATYCCISTHLCRANLREGVLINIERSYT